MSTTNDPEIIRRGTARDKRGFWCTVLILTFVSIVGMIWYQATGSGDALLVAIGGFIMFIVCCASYDPVRGPYPSTSRVGFDDEQIVFVPKRELGDREQMRWDELQSVHFVKAIVSEYIPELSVMLNKNEREGICLFSDAEGFTELCEELHRRFSRDGFKQTVNEGDETTGLTTWEKPTLQ